MVKLTVLTIQSVPLLPKSIKIVIPSCAYTGICEISSDPVDTRKWLQATGGGLETRCRLYFLHFIPESIPKTTCGKLWTYGPTLLKPPIKYNDSRGCEFDPQHRLCFCIFYTEKTYKTTVFIKYNKIRPDYFGSSR